MGFVKKIPQNFLFIIFFSICLGLFCYETKVSDDIVIILNDISDLIGLDEIFTFIQNIIQSFFDFLYSMPLIKYLVDEIGKIWQDTGKNVLSTLTLAEKTIDTLNMGYVLVVMLGSTLVTEIARKHITESTTKIFAVNTKPFYKYYTNEIRFKCIVVLVILGYIYSTELMLLFIMIALIFYCFNIVFVHDYTNKVREGIKSGYFDYINFKKRGKTSLFAIRKKELYASCKKLLEGLAVYTTFTHKNTDVIEEYNISTFNIDILKTFYNDHLDNESIGIFVNQLSKSMCSVYKKSKSKELFLSYYEDILNDVFSDAKTDVLGYKKIITIAIIFIVDKVFNKLDDEKETCLNMLEECRALDINSTRQSVLLSVYMIVFWESQYKKEGIKNYSALIGICNNVVEIDNFSNEEINEVLDMCKIIIGEVLEYSEMIINDFESDFCYILSYVGSDFYDMYMKYEEELR